MVAFYIVYEVSRGIAVGDPGVALHHAHQVAQLEQSLSIFVEREVQVVAQAIPGLLGLLSVAYLTLHLTVSIGCLVWVYRCHPSAFPVLRNTLLLATAIAVIGYIVFARRAAASRRHGDRRHRLERARRPQLWPCPRAVQPVRRDAEHALRLRSNDRKPRGGAESPPGGHRLAGYAYPVFVLLVIVRDREPLPARCRGRRIGRGRRLPSAHIGSSAAAELLLVREVTPSASDVAASAKVAMFGDECRRGCQSQRAGSHGVETEDSGSQRSARWCHTSIHPELTTA